MRSNEADRSQWKRPGRGAFARLIRPFHAPARLALHWAAGAPPGAPTKSTGHSGTDQILPPAQRAWRPSASLAARPAKRRLDIICNLIFIDGRERASARPRLCCSLGVVALGALYECQFILPGRPACAARAGRQTLSLIDFNRIPSFLAWPIECVGGVQCARLAAAHDVGRPEICSATKAARKTCRSS